MLEKKRILYHISTAVLLIVVIGGFFVFYLPRTGRPCVIDNCHGLDISCGPEALNACTEIYAVGDSCRQYASCEKVNGECRPKGNDRFESCKSCVEQCQADFKDDSPGLFQCEESCGSYGQDYWSERCPAEEYGIYNDSLGVNETNFFISCEPLRNCSSNMDCDYLAIGKLPPRSGVCLGGSCKAYCGSGILQEC